jgi:hypothetical protein
VVAYFIFYFVHIYSRPAKDAGDSEHIPMAGITDFIGRARVCQGKTDIGAYKYTED